jgi:hypothetical protein
LAEKILIHTLADPHHQCHCPRRLGRWRSRVLKDCSNPTRSSRLEHEPREIVMPPAKKAAPAAKKSAVPAKATPQMTVTLKHLAAALSDSHDLPKKQAEAVLGDW